MMLICRKSNYILVLSTLPFPNMKPLGEEVQTRIEFIWKLWTKQSMLVLLRCFKV